MQQPESDYVPRYAQAAEPVFYVYRIPVACVASGCLLRSVDVQFGTVPIIWLAVSGPLIWHWQAN